MKTLMLTLWMIGSLASGARADDLGRLFFTPGERAQFDLERRRANQPAPPPPSVTAAELAARADAVPPPLQAMTLNGVVRRRAGPSTVWINGETRDSRAASLPDAAGARVRLTPDAVEFALDPTAQWQSIKPGQTYDPARARMVDAYETPPPPEP